MEKIKIGKRVLLSSDVAMLNLFFLDMVRICQVAALEWSEWRLYYTSGGFSS